MQPSFLLFCGLLTLYGGAAGRMASAEPAAPAPLPERAAALEREIARVQALCAARASIASRLEAELGNLARRLSALRLQNAILATENSRVTRESLAADTRLRRLTRDVETGRGEYGALLAKYGDSEARAGRLQARVTELEERLASNRPDPDAIAAARARITELHKAYRTLRATRPHDPTRLCGKTMYCGDTDNDEEDSGTCKETFALAPASRGTAAARQVSSARVRILWGLDPRRRAGYVPHECRPPTNNALLYFLANQPSTTVTVAAGALGKTTFSVSAQGRHTSSGTTLTWQLSLSVTRLGRR